MTFILFVFSFNDNFIKHLQAISLTSISIAGLTLMYIYSFEIENHLVYIFVASYLLLITAAFSMAGLLFINALIIVSIFNALVTIIFLQQFDSVPNILYAILFISANTVAAVSAYFSEITRRKMFFKDLYLNQLVDALHDTQTQLISQHKELEEKQIMITHQARFASMGEMIGNIVHQWRQPLNALSLSTQKLGLYYERGKLDEVTLNKSIEKSMNLIEGMSSTIDDFRNFFNPSKEKEGVLIAEAIYKASVILQETFKHNNIDYRFSTDDITIKVKGYKNELSQVIINLLNNAKDVLIEKQINSAYISISIDQDNDKIYIMVEDNGGGIDSELINKVFEPYFTTKEEGKGTGIGLYMSKMIIQEHMGGKLNVNNNEMGACFTITFDKEKVG